MIDSWIGASVFVIFGMILCYIVTRIPNTNFHAKTTHLELSKELPLVPLEKLSGHILTIFSIHEMQSGNAIFWTIQAQNDSPISVYTMDSSIAWRLRKLKKGVQVLISNQDGVLDFGAV